ncbi:MAG: class I fructose-bisphosphate aldolase [Jatrophihabitans sp.]|uniref:class I fructose-bisphosphate aldolase n=1 Tax=Jatrophihabitans sp. TaxID=1932789 RepID=UPI003F7F0396
MSTDQQARPRLRLDAMGLAVGKRARLHRILYGAGHRNGTLLLLPYDQGLEHGPRDFHANPMSGDPAHIARLARRGGFNGLVLHVGLAEKFFWDFAGEVPLILKLNGKTEIPSDDQALSPLQAGVEDAVRLGADAVGYTLYVGTPAQDRDFAQLRQVRADAVRLGMPLIVWAYPRGAAIEAKGGRSSFYAVDYAARVASELGADVVKLSFPSTTATVGAPLPYDEGTELSAALEAVVRSANRSMVIMAGGSHLGDREVVDRARSAVRAGATGLIFGRNVWQRRWDDALWLVEELHAVLDEAADETSDWP